MSLGLIFILIVVFGYASNWLNWKYLNYKITRLLYYIGAFVHESSHALLCLTTGAKIYDFKVLSTQPHITHGKSKLPFLGETLISLAPIAGGLFFLFLVNRSILNGHFIVTFSANQWNLIGQLLPWEWQTWVMIALSINVGAMIGPSFQDIKNIWPVLIILFFVHWTVLADIGLIALSLILINIALQIILILCLKLFFKKT